MSTSFIFLVHERLKLEHHQTATSSFFSTWASSKSRDCHDGCAWKSSTLHQAVHNIFAFWNFKVSQSTWFYPLKTYGCVCNAIFFIIMHAHRGGRSLLIMQPHEGDMVSPKVARWSCDSRMCFCSGHWFSPSEGISNCNKNFALPCFRGHDAHAYILLFSWFPLVLLMQDPGVFCARTIPYCTICAPKIALKKP